MSEAWGQAIAANDAAGIGAVMSDDWVMVSNRGVSNKAQFLDMVASGQLTHSAMQLEELASIRVYGETAILIARVTNTAHFAGRTFDANEWTSDVFVKARGEWKCVSTHITEAEPG